MMSANEVLDDLGSAWRFDQDSPAAIVLACQRSVRRWRLARMGEVLPGLIPATCDIPDLAHFRHTVLVDFASILAPFVNARGAGARASDSWSPAWKGALTSAICGGQWPQARRAAVPSWNITDSSCQLCKAAVGTLGHRFECPATRPPEGWPAPPAEAAGVAQSLSSTRRQWLHTRGLLVLRVPSPPDRGEGSFAWHAPPDLTCPLLEDATWYLDGSMLHGRWTALRSTGFAVVVVAAAGDLLAYGSGAPPR